jgi:hypothetical protein
MRIKRNWSVQDVSLLFTQLRFLRSPSEIAATLDRDEDDVRERMAQLGLIANHGTDGERQRCPTSWLSSPSPYSPSTAGVGAAK